MLQPEENHADHCFMVAVYASLMAPAFGADPVRCWWFGTVHHLHNAAMPDAGFTGEMLLEPHLGAVIEEARRQALDELEGDLREAAAGVFEEIGGDGTPEARAFHAADVIDRVLEIEHHVKARSVTMDTVLGEYELVHEGPVKGFHDDVLRAVGLP
nr:HD domain-containing protein [Parvularcula dongshanensis]